LVKDEYRYVISAWAAAFCLSDRAAEMLAPMPKLDHNEEIPDMTLLTLETECMEPTSEPWLLDLCVLLRNDT
jgi:hypothetical protein